MDGLTVYRLIVNLKYKYFSNTNSLISHSYDRRKNTDRRKVFLTYLCT